ncbi:MAG: sodium:calcium antiporter [Candidatus Odinarchaeota archaeon]
MPDDNHSEEPHMISSAVEVHKVFHISRREQVVALLLLVFLLLALFLFQNMLILIIAMMTFGLWLTFRGSHFAIDGLESMGAFAGLSAYVIGVLSSLASNTPEAVVSGLTAWRGIVTSSPELVEIAVLSVVMAAGFNILLLGIVVVISARKTGVVKVPREVVEDDADLIRWTIVAMALLFAFGILFYVDHIIHGLTPDLIFLPPLLGFLMLLSYVLYAVYAIKKPKPTDRVIPKPRHSKRNSALLAILGFVGIFFAGYLLSEAVELTFNFVPWTGLGIIEPQRIVIMALIIGAAGALPEHGIALIAASKSKANIAIGNTLGGTTQILLLIVGGAAIFLPLPLDAAVLLQFATAAGSLWFLIRAMADDEKVDIFEGAMILLMQAFVFILVLLPI